MPRAIETRDHDTIRRWAEERDGHPAIAGRGVLRIDFGDPEEGLEPISWEEFFDRLDDADLVFLFSPQEGSRFNKFVRPEGGPAARGRSHGSRQNVARRDGPTVRGRTGTVGSKAAPRRSTKGSTASSGRTSARRRTSSRGARARSTRSRRR